MKALPLVIALTLAGALLTACGGRRSAPSSQPSGNEVVIGWATVAREATGVTRAAHLGDGSINDAYQYAKSVCEVAIEETSSDAIRRACDTMRRAATTPRIAAATIYESAFADFDAAGAKLSPDDLTSPVRNATLLKIFDAQDPLSATPRAKVDWVPITERLDFLFEHVPFVQAARGGEWVRLTDELRGGRPLASASIPLPSATKVANSWSIIRSVLFPDAPTPATE